MSTSQAPHGPFKAYAGFISIPRYFDYSPQEFLRIAPDRVGVIQRVLHLPDYTYTLSQRANNLSLLEESAICLGESNCQVIGQTGTNWVHCAGKSPDEMRDFCARVSERCGAIFLMMGLCIVDALREIGAKRISVSNGYYWRDWAEGMNHFLRAAGFDLAWSGTMVDQQLYDSDEQLNAHAEEVDWCFPSSEVVKSIHLAHLAAPDADAVVQTGFGFRTVSHVSAIEAIIEKPLVSSDLSLYWAMLRQLQVAPRPGFGTLIETLI